MNQRKSMDLATMLAAIVVLIVGLSAVAFERGCASPGRDSVAGALSGSTLGTPIPAFLRPIRSSRSALFRRGGIFDSGGSQPLREKTSAAFGVGRGAVAEALPGDCPPMHCPRLFV